MLAHAYGIIINHIVCSPVDGKDVVSGLNYVDINYLYTSMDTSKMSRSK